MILPQLSSHCHDRRCGSTSSRTRTTRSGRSRCARWSWSGFQYLETKSVQIYLQQNKTPIITVKILTWYDLSTNGDVIDSLKQQAANPAQLILHSFPGQVSTWFSIKGPWEKQAGQVSTWFYLKALSRTIPCNFYIICNCLMQVILNKTPVLKTCFTFMFLEDNPPYDLFTKRNCMNEMEI